MKSDGASASMTNSRTIAVPGGEGRGVIAAIAIPAQDEARRLPACLQALAEQRQVDHGQVAVLVLANNCRDATAAVARSMAARMPFGLVVQEAVLPDGLAHAGGARRAAMDAAAGLLRRDGAALLSTDADSMAEPGWLAANLAALAAGADAVAGAITLDPREAACLPAPLLAREVAEAAYASLLDEIAALVDPDPADPWPRHGFHSGASIAISLRAYRRIGGLPPLPVGEDRALFQCVARQGMRVRHCPAARVRVSCRLRGRAAGGMADTLRNRLQGMDQAQVDGRLEPAQAALFRLRCRHALRRLHGGQPLPGDPQRLASRLGLRVEAILAAAGQRHFWPGWEAVQVASRRLQARPMLLRDLPREAARAKLILRRLRQPAASPAAGPGDSDPSLRC